MRKVHYCIILAVLAILPSCSNKEELAEPQSPRRLRGVLEATTDDLVTRAYAKENLSLYWNQNDYITVFPQTVKKEQWYYDGLSGSTDGYFYPATEGGEGGLGGQAGEFNDEAAEYYYAIYPYHSYHSIDYDGTMMLYYPPVQQYNSNGIGVSPILVSRGKDMNLFFKHAAGYLGFHLYGSGVSVSSISITSNNGEPLSGFPYVGFDDDEVPTVSFYGHEVDSPSCTIKYEPAIELGTSSDVNDCKIFWISLPPVTLMKGYTLTVKDISGREFVFKSTKTRTIKRKVFQQFTPIEVVFEEAVVHVQSVSLDKTELNLNVGENTTLIAAVMPENADDKAVTWSSSNTSVATVDDDGTVSAVAAGSAVITATTADGGKIATCIVTVTPATVAVESVSLDKTSLSLVVGDTETITATVNPDNASNKTVNWSSSSTAVATVDANGNITAVAVGTAVIIASTVDGGKTAFCTVTVTASAAVPVQSVSLNKTELSLNVGESVTLTATVLPENADNKAVTWSSSDAAVATVDSNGKVSAVAAGSAVITVKTTDGEKTATCTVTVIADKDPNHAGDPVEIEEGGDL